MSTEVGREYDEIEGMKKLERQIEDLTKIFRKLGDRVNKQQITQFAKIHQQKEKDLKIDKQHHDLRVKQIAVQKAATIQAFAERQQEIRLTKQLTHAMKNQKSAYDGVFQTLGGGTGLRQGLFMMTGRLNEMRKATQAVTEATKNFEKEMKSSDSTKVDALYLDVRNKQKVLDKMTFNSKTLQGMSDRLAKLANFMEENQGKVLIGAGVASVLVGIISKALNVAPMFQAMLKLMQLAVNMILMPIGTFIGAMVKPFLILLIRTLAPAFQEAMKMAMNLGADVGKFFVSPSTAIANGIRDFINPPATDSDGNPVYRDPIEGNPALDIGLGVGGTVLGLTGLVALTKKVIPRVLTGTMGMFGATNNIQGKAMSNAGTGSPLNALTKGLGGHGTKSVLSSLLKVSSRVAMPLMVADLVSSLLSPTAGGAHSDGMTTKREQALQGNAFDHMNVMFQDFLGMFGVSNDLDKKIKDPLSPLHDSEDAILEGTEGLINGMEKVDKFEKVMDKIAMEGAPTMDQQTLQIMNTFIRMKEMTNDSKEAMVRTAELFSLAEATVEAKIQNWIKIIPPKADGTERPEKRQARQALSWYQSGQADTSSLKGRMGNAGWNTWEKANQGTKTTLQDRLEKEAERAKEAFNRANPQLGGNAYNDIYGTKETTPSGHKYPAGFNPSGITRSQMEKQISGGFLGGLGTTSTGAVDYSSILGNYNGGQISEPILGIGRSGRTYSFGEHGAETITPNGQMGGGGGITINIGKIEKNADFEQLKPMIQRWILEANSRRGII